VHNFPLLDNFDNFSLVSFAKGNEAYLYSAWVNIAVGILIRNIARADFALLRGGDYVKTGPLYELFRRPKRLMSRFGLWKETAAWWYLEGEAFWWAGPEYSGGILEELYVLDPRKLHHEGEGLGALSGNFRTRTHRWFYQTDRGLIPILSDELIHFRDWSAGD
jgi:hypothetical protein